MKSLETYFVVAETWRAVSVGERQTVYKYLEVLVKITIAALKRIEHLTSTTLPA